MIKKFYLFAWFVLIGSALASIFTGTFGAESILGVSLGAAALVYAFALWAVLNQPHAQTASG